MDKAFCRMQQNEAARKDLFQVREAVSKVTDADGRAVKTTFNITLQGYIIPDVINKQIASANSFYSTSQVIFNFETTYESR
jgi:hypothetical protein